MAGGGGGRSLEDTPTWAVAIVCLALVVISIFIEYLINLVGKWLIRRQKTALHEALEKVKSELMLLGFISLLLTVGQGPISDICISKSVGDTWHPCPKSKQAVASNGIKSDVAARRGLLEQEQNSTITRRVLAGGGYDKCAPKNMVPLVSTDGIHQLHIFIFVLAVFHILYCISTLALGRLKMRKWKAWEQEAHTMEYQFTHDPERYRFARETSFGRRHLSFWSRSPVLVWIVCFFRQFFTSVTKADFMTLRHGFIMAHLAPTSSTKFNFQNYIKRCLEEDFKIVVGISPLIWFSAVVFLLFNTHGWYSYFWLPFIPLIVILLIGAKLQMIITNMANQIMDRRDVVRGVPQVHLTNDHFWFHRPRLILLLIHFVLFQNAFQLAFFAWSTYEFGLKSCFHEHIEDIAIRVSMGVIIQVLCSYVTLPLYALVTQMGSNMRSTIFNERIAMALKKWHNTAKKNVKEAHHRSGSASPLHSRSPAQGLSPVHLLHHSRSDPESVHSSPMFYNMEEVSSSHKYTRGAEKDVVEENGGGVHAINISMDFSFDGNARNG
ncbi:MLO-like protein 12 [Wolffia australiana]